MISRRKFGVLGAASTALFSGVPVLAETPAGQRRPYSIPHTLRYATGSEPGSLNPLLRQEFVGSLLAQLTMAYLFRYDHRNRPYPELALSVPTQQNGGISRDGKTIVFRLRRGVRWADGEPFGAKDLVFTWKCVMDDRNNITTRIGWEEIVRIDTPDEYTAIFRLRRPYGSYLPTFYGTGGANPCILPAHLFKDTAINEAPYNALPIGIGPFKYVKWQRGAEIELVANELYWRGKPKLERIVSKLVTDRNTVLTQLQSHEIDLWVAASAAYWDRLQNIPGVKTVKQAGMFFDHLDFNMTSPILRERAVREALRYSIDRVALNRIINHGVGIVQEPMYSAVHPMSDTSIPRIPYDPAKARALLDGAGWKPGTDGVRVRNGQRLTLDFVTASGTPDTDAAIELMRTWWKTAGIEINVLHYASPMLFATYNEGGIILKGKFDIAAFAWLPPASGNFNSLYSSRQIPPLGQNDLRYRNAKVDVWPREFDATYDESERRHLDSLIMRQVIADVPTVVLRIREDIYSYNDDLVGFNPNATTPFDDMMLVDI